PECDQAVLAARVDPVAPQPDAHPHGAGHPGDVSSSPWALRARWTSPHDAPAIMGAYLLRVPGGKNIRAQAGIPLFRRASRNGSTWSRSGSVSTAGAGTLVLRCD